VFSTAEWASKADIRCVEIRNPIHLARVILDASNKPLSLRRVPPNLLVGQGATDFAYEHNIPVVPHSMVVSKNARDRFLRWQSDLVRAEKNAARLTPRSSSPASSQAGEDEILDREYEERVRDQQRRDHMNAILHGTWNEGQPDSPQPSPRLEKTQTQLEPMPCPAARQQPTSNPTLYNDPSTTSAPHGRNLSPDSSPSKRPRFTKGHSEGHIRTRSLLGPSASNSELYKSVADTRMAYNELDISPQARPGRNDGPTSPIDQPLQARFLPSQPPQQQDTTRALFHSLSAAADEDMITDTVGAIAIDMYGNIAAGSSSGGIGMKHRGRVGPAALVGIGTAVVPADEQDPDGICVAAVTSGTGEHMATTMASQKCADRLYHNTRRARGGADVEATEEEAMESFVVTDFMGHPGVSGSNSAGAIGVMAVKKTPYGIFLHFAHNTDSFAIASMHSDEKDAKCVMSRLGDHGTVVRGGRKIRC
jgi:taspase (threonine aspartase 1)